MVFCDPAPPPAKSIAVPPPLSVPASPPAIVRAEIVAFPLAVIPTALDAVVPWPGRSNSSPVFLNFGKSTYVAAHFLVPAGTPPTWFGWITHTEYQYGTDLTGAISTICGDFTPAAQHCFTAGTSGQLIVPWRTSAGSFCELTPGVDYYLNLKIRDPAQSNVSCAPSATDCIIGTANALSMP